MEDTLMENTSPSTEAVPLTTIKGNCLQHVIEYMAHCEAHPEEMTRFQKGGKIDAFTPWDTVFAQKMKSDLWIFFEVMMASNFLEVKSLLELMFRSWAGMMQGKTDAEICQLFNIRTDATPEEIAAIKAANPWLEDV